MLVLSGCTQAPSLATQGASEPEAAPAAQVPAGWATHTSQRCEYAISYPSDWEVTDQGRYSQLFSPKPASADDAFPNFVYVSVVAPEIQKWVGAGAYQSEVYNYVPAETEALLGLQVGGSASLSENVELASAFTYRRQADVAIGGQTAGAYTNAAPWEFPAGTKETRYYTSLDGCTYLIGGYMDTTGSSQPGAISEDLFRQVMATVQWVP